MAGDQVPGMEGWTFADEPAKSDTDHPESASPNSGLTLAALGKMTPQAAWQAMRLATSPTVPKTMATAGRVIASVASPVVGTAQGGPLGTLVGVSEMPKAAWAGGKAGWFGGKMLQNMAAPVANVLEKAAPIAEAVSKVGGLQGALDLAQMAEPHRKDIGFLGIGASMPDLDVLTKAIAKGANPAQAAAQIASGNPQRFGQLMTAYMQSRQVK